MPISEQLLRIERWRTRLIDEGFDAIEAFVAAYPRADRKLLKRFVQEAASMHHQHQMPRKPLRYIRALDDAAGAHPPQ
ncbi:DUF615 domain-containing protein [Lysobacter enzymogenes]|uniref:dual-action ribosomal maturation protein DarP n=1 Tax=Lysobacter enzymogenes TaxID=69 RepID=UPI001A9687B9|nr:DUF615 domain-containing protein [Lysobacter enzymogenes]QQP97891.1 DUF615 domain-containing protein [Lysobacter enzymogenes]